MAVQGILTAQEIADLALEAQAAQVTNVAVQAANQASTVWATITTTRRGTNPLAAERVDIKKPHMMPAVNAAGMVILTEIVLRQDADIRKGDSVAVTEMDGFDSLTRQEGYTVEYVARFAGKMHAYVEGTIQ